MGQCDGRIYGDRSTAFHIENRADILTSVAGWSAERLRRGGGNDNITPTTPSEFLYVSDTVGELFGFAIDPTSGTLAPIRSGHPMAVVGAGFAGVVRIAADPNGTNLYVSRAAVDGGDSRSLGASNSFYGNEKLPRLSIRAEGRHTMPGGPLLPTLPPNPFAKTARRIGTADKMLGKFIRFGPDRDPAKSLRTRQKVASS